MGQEIGLSLQIWFWIAISCWDLLIASISLSSTMPRFMMYVFEIAEASKMIEFSPLFRMEKASGSIWLFNPLWWVEPRAPLASGFAAFAAVQWRRMMNRMHQPIPFPMRVLMRLNSSFMNSSMGVKILSIMEFSSVVSVSFRFSDSAAGVAMLVLLEINLSLSFTFSLVLSLNLSDSFRFRDPADGELEIIILSIFTFGLCVNVLSTSLLFDNC